MSPDMPDPLTVQLNGQMHTFQNLIAPITLNILIAALEFKSDRIAVEHNGEIASRSTWPNKEVSQGDRLEIVHFVGGGCTGTRS
jgi:sulfur carrier protein